MPEFNVGDPVHIKCEPETISPYRVIRQAFIDAKMQGVITEIDSFGLPYAVCVSTPDGKRKEYFDEKELERIEDQS